MRFSSAVIDRAALAIAIFAVPIAAAQSSAPRDYSFTIPTTQVWTDTGVDLLPGELLDISAVATQSSNGGGNHCDPRGSSAATEGDAGLPLASAAAGSLIGRLQAQGEAVAVGNSRRLKVEAPGHLFFGVNAQSPPNCSGSFAVKVHVTSAAGTPVGNSLAATSPVASSPATPASSPSSAAAATPAAQSNAQSPPAQDVKSKLANAAQVFLAGQFGAGAAQTTTAAAPMANDAASASPSVSASAAAAPALTLSTATLDSGLRRTIDELPRRVNDQFNNQGDMVNFVLVGSAQLVQSALEAANWHVADTDNKEAVLKAVLETYQKKDYLAMPMSQLYLFGRKQDFGYELAAAYSVVASRHHFRIWKAPNAWNGRTLWAGAGTHDIGFEKDQRNGSVTHKIDPAVDGERDNIGSTLQRAGKVKSLSYYLPPDPVQGAKNATGGGYHSDGRILVIVLQ